MTCGIYKIKNNINNKIYIGQSVDIEKRWNKHLYATDDFVIHKAIRKYGKNNFTFSILEECEMEFLDEKENYWIAYYDSTMPKGYNMIPGGSNGAGLAKGHEVNQYDLKGNFIASYRSANQASQATGIDHWSICACCRGEYKHSGGYQWKYCDDDIKEIKPIKVRVEYAVLQIDKNSDKIIQEFQSIKEASIKTSIASSTICNVCNGKGKTAGGYKWKFKNDLNI